MHTIRIDSYIGQSDGGMFGAEMFGLSDMIAEFALIPASEKDVNIEINSGGGSVIEGFAIHDYLKSQKSYNIHTTVLGLCGSIATIIGLSAKKENRSMHKNSEYFVHNPHWRPTSPEPMEAEDLKNLAEDLQANENKMIRFYAKETGLSEDKIKQLMDRQTSFSADEAKNLGFVSTVITDEVKAQRKYLIAAFYNPKEKTKDMDFTPTQKTWIEQKLNDFGKKFSAMFKPDFKAMVIDLESGTKIFIESDDGEFVGKKAFKVDAEGNPTTEPADDGDHKLKDGRTITVKEGVVTMVAEAAKVDETTALKTEVEELKAKLIASETAAATATATIATKEAEFQAKLTAMNTEFTALKSVVLGGTVSPADQNFKGGAGAQPQTELEKRLALKREQQAKAKAAIEAKKK